MFRKLIDSGRFLGISELFHSLERDLICLTREIENDLSEKLRRGVYAAAIKHLRLLHPCEKLLKPQNGSGVKRYTRALKHYSVRREYGKMGEEFFREYAPPNDVLRELARIGRRDFKEVNKEQLENFIKLVRFHEGHYSGKFAEIHSFGCSGF